MRIERTHIEGVVQLWPAVHGDARGYFFESFQAPRFAEMGLAGPWLQDNESYSRRGVVRGLHYQLPPHAQAKLVRAVVGRILDVAVDIRPGSPTFGLWVARILDDSEHSMLYIPRGFAHGFSVLSDVAVVLYKCDALWHQESERGIAYNDPHIGIDWQLEGFPPIVSPKDALHPMLSEASLPAPAAC